MPGRRPFIPFVGFEDVKARCGHVEKFGLLPYRFADLAGFHLVQAIPGGTAILTSGPGDATIAAQQPFFMIQLAASAPGLAERESFARRLLAGTIGFDQFRVAQSGPIHFGPQRLTRARHVAQVVHRPRQRVRRRVLPREQHRQGIAEEHRVGERPPLVVPRDQHRLDRDLTGRFGSAAYAMEECTVELLSAMICADLNLTVEPRPDHARYIASWLEVLRSDKRAILTAANKAQQIADWMHAQQPT